MYLRTPLKPASLNMNLKRLIVEQQAASETMIVSPPCALSPINARGAEDPEVAGPHL